MPQWYIVQTMAAMIATAMRNTTVRMRQLATFFIRNMATMITASPMMYVMKESFIVLLVLVEYLQE